MRNGICRKCGTDRELFMNSQVCKVCAAEQSRATLHVKREKRLALKAEQKASKHPAKSGVAVPVEAAADAMWILIAVVVVNLTLMLLKGEFGEDLQKAAQSALSRMSETGRV